MADDEVVVIGAGSAGLAVSQALTRRGVAHVILERGRIGETWRSERWDSFTMVTPTWRTALPGLAHDGCDPDGFLTLADWFAYLDRFVARFQPPAREGVTVRTVQPAWRDRFLIETEHEVITARAVVVATGFFRTPVVPPLAADLPRGISAIPSTHYRNPEALPDGAVLVVGSGQSGSQIAEELNAAGRMVYLSVGRVGRSPRRYRGRDFYWWRIQPGFALGFRERPVSAAQVTGKDGGRDLNFHRFARDGMMLLGRLEAIEGTELTFAADLHQRLEEADAADLAFRRAADAFILERGLDYPPDPLPNGEGLRDAYSLPPRRNLDLHKERISSVIWATGFRPDYSWITYPVLDGDGYPRCENGATAVGGLYFAGTRWQLPGATTLIGGVGDEAEQISSSIARYLAHA